MAELLITVRGAHETRVAPERGIAHVSVVADGPERGPVVERMAALAAPLRNDLAARAEAGTLLEWSSDRVSVWSDRPWNDQGVQLDLVHHASVELTATFTDFAVLSWWLGDLAEGDGVQVRYMQWELSPESHSRVEREVATSAVGVAVERATAYAAALGFASVEPVEIADLGLLSRSDAGQPEMARMMVAGAAPGGYGRDSVDLRPADIVISAEVEARFRAV